MAQLRLQQPFPDQGFQAVEFQIVNPSQSSESLSGKIRRISQGISHYAFTVQYPTITKEKLSTIMGYLSQTMGNVIAFDIVLPIISYSKLGAQQTTNTVTVTGGTQTWTEGGTSKTGYLAGSMQVLIQGSANAKVFAIGDVFRFNDNNFPGNDNTNKHLKVYMATSETTMNASGGTTLFFSGGLVDNVPNGTTLTITEVPFQVIIASGEQTFQIGQSGLSTLEFECREVWG
jgi:uncharacterized protein YaiE (UPF0345 family)